MPPAALKSVWGSFKKSCGAIDVQAGETIAQDAVSKRQEWLGVTIFSFLFFSWGLAYGLLDIMNYHIKVAMATDRAHAAQLALAYYIAYFPGPLLIGGPVIKTFGYRLAAVVGLVLLATGDQVMSLGASHLNFSLMCAAHFVVGLGVSTLERCANAYVVELGPRKRATLRILVAQSAAAFGTVVAPLLANAAIFDPNESNVKPLADPINAGRCLMPPPPSPGEAGDLSTVVSFYQYLGIAIFGFAFLLAVVFFRTSLVVEPHVPKSPKLEHSRLKVWKHPLLSTKYARLWYGVIANFLNLGCQVAVAQFYMEHMRVNDCASEKSSATDMMIAQILFLVGRLFAVGLIELPSIPFIQKSPTVHSVFRPRYVLAAFLGLAAAFTGAGIEATGKVAVACACMIMFSEAPSFPMIFEAATAGLEEWTPSCESIMIVSISGGGILPLAMGILTDHIAVSRAWALPTACFGVVFSYTLMCNIVPSFREAIDKAHESYDSSPSSSKQPTQDLEMVGREGSPEL